jgi:hypothetical protein
MAKCRMELQRVTCTICFGDKSVLVKLGDGSHVSVVCDYCGKGYDGPKGYTEEYRWVVEPELIEITGVSRYEESGREFPKIEYRYNGNFIAQNERLFETEEEAANESLRIKEEHDRAEEERKAHRKKHNLKDITWRVGYHQRAIREHKKDMEHHEKQIRILKEKGSV